MIMKEKKAMWSYRVTEAEKEAILRLLRGIREGEVSLDRRVGENGLNQKESVVNGAAGGDVKLLLDDVERLTRENDDLKRRLDEAMLLGVDDRIAFLNGQLAACKRRVIQLENSQS